jgi:hypothetical protein
MALWISQNQSTMAASMIRSTRNKRKAARRYSGLVIIVAIRRRRAVTSPPFPSNRCKFRTKLAGVISNSSGGRCGNLNITPHSIGFPPQSAHAPHVRF